MTHSFYTRESFGGTPRRYHLLPFRFTRLDPSELLVNEAGEYLITTRGTVEELVRHRLPTNTELYQSLKAKHFLFDDETSALLDVLATKIRTKKSSLDHGPILHIMVLTQRCDNACTYCQVTRQPRDRWGCDMTTATARRSIEWIMTSPSKHVTIEFQGGEPLLAFKTLQYAINTAKELAAQHNKDITFVLATNLASATDEILAFLRDHDVKISTSLDGPEALHNQNRPRHGQNSYQVTVGNIKRAREYVGHANVSALMTTTRSSLPYAREIVDEYARQGFGSIFLRGINPYGLAIKNPYTTEEFLEFYKAALDHIITLNKAGTPMAEVFATIILTKILTPYPTGYVDLQSPTGSGTMVLAYHYNGDVYASDESRMLAEMGDNTFRLGNVHRDSPATVTRSPAFEYLMNASCNEALPGCADCAYQAYCGSDPVRNHATQGDAYGHRPTSTFCKKHHGIVTHLFRLIQRADPDLMGILFGWIRGTHGETSTLCD